jgi:copper transporter 1
VVFFIFQLLANGNSQMLWNWYTVDSCFLSRSWHITSKGMFAGSCIAVILLVILLEFLRRVGKDYDRYIIRDHQRRYASASSSPNASTDDGGRRKNEMGVMMRSFIMGSMSAGVFRPTILQQAVRAALHMAAFAVAYIVML